MKFKALKTKLTAENKPFYVITVEDKEMVLRKPDRSELSVITKIMSTNEIKGAEHLFQTCWLGGDKEMVTNVDYFLAAMTQIETLFETKDVEFIELEDNTFRIIAGDLNEEEEYDNKKECIIKKPTITDLAIIMSLSAQDPIKSNEEYLSRCWVSGDEEIQTNDEYFLAVCSVLDNLINIKTASIKKN